MVVPDLFSREQTAPPTVTLAVWVGLVALAASIVLVCYRYRDRVATSWVLRGLQVSQLLIGLMIGTQWLVQRKL